jgi:hypothetical protein
LTNFAAKVNKASRRVGANKVIISPVLSPLLADVLNSCAKGRFDIDDEGYVEEKSVAQSFEMKFNSAIEDIFSRINFLLSQKNPTSLLDSTVDYGFYDSPDSSREDVRQLQNVA